MKRTVLFPCVYLLVGSCQTITPIAPLPLHSCRVIGIDKGPTNRHTYAYDSQGRVAQMIRETDEKGKIGTVRQYVYRFTYVGNQLVGSSWTIDGKAAGTARYVYAASRIVRADLTYADGTKGTNTFTYKTGRVSEYTTESGNPLLNGKRYFAYDANGIIVKTGFSDLRDTRFFEVLVRPTGLVRSPEQLLLEAGLPFDVLTGYPWQIAEGEVGTEYDVYFSNSTTGKLEFAYSDRTTIFQATPTGYLTEQTLQDQRKNTQTQRYILENCQ